MSIAFETTPPTRPQAGPAAEFSTPGPTLRRRVDAAEPGLPVPPSWGAGGPRPFRPGVGFLHPLEVVKDEDLDVQDKREILAAWASDASAVPHRPSQRWLLGTPAPVPLSEVLSALSRLDRIGFS